MVRNSSLRSLTTTALSSAFILVFLAGCSNKKNSQSSGITGSLQKAAAQPARVGRIPTRGRAPLKASPRVKQATRLAAAFKQNPADSKVALDYVYTLRSLGMGQRAVTILHQAYQANPTHPVIASEYGRLLLGSGKTTQAQRVLGRINKKAAPDWHTLSALGTIEARDGSYEKATEYFRQANELAPKKASIINNLALSIALGGHPDEAENLLRNADDSGRFGARLRQNLALVLALQGKYDEAQAMATTDLSPKQAGKNIAYLKRMLATTDSQGGIEMIDETTAPTARTMAGNGDQAPETTAAIDAPTNLVPNGPAQN